VSRSIQGRARVDAQDREALWYTVLEGFRLIRMIMKVKSGAEVLRFECEDAGLRLPGFPN
jgi:hypothetical protein